MRPPIKEFVAIAAHTLPIEEPIYEFGSLQVAGQEGFADLRPLFPGRQYVGADMRPGRGVDRVLDLHDIALPSESVGTVLCLDTLEHVEFPRDALKEIQRVLKPGGVAVISSVMCFPIHDYPFDYWRFTPAAFASILKPFRHSFVGFAGEEDFPHTVVGLGFKGEAPPLARFLGEYEHWQARQRVRPEGVSFKRVARLVLPPIGYQALSRAYRLLHGLTRTS